MGPRALEDATLWGVCLLLPPMLRGEPPAEPPTLAPCSLWPSDRGVPLSLLRCDILTKRQVRNHKCSRGRVYARWFIG